MLRLDLIRGRPVHVPLRVMEAEAALLLTAARFFVSVEIRERLLAAAIVQNYFPASGAMPRPQKGLPTQ